MSFESDSELEKNEISFHFTILGPKVCRIIVKCSILTSNDVLIKFGTKPIAMRAEPLKVVLQPAGVANCISMGT